MNWEKLQQIYTLSRQKQVGFSMNYCEADDSWFFCISSISPSEEWMGKNHSFDIAVECTLEWLRKI